MIVEKPLIFLTDRSAVEMDDTCGMKYWLNRKEGRRGIVPKEEPLALMVGSATHKDLQTVASWDHEMLQPKNIQVELDTILGDLTIDDKANTPKMEILYRRLGWLAAFALYIEPRIRERYEGVSIEAEIILDRDPLWVAATPDRVLRRKSDKKLEYREYKTTISASNQWMHSWQYAIQLHIGIAAAQEELKEKVHFAQIMGLMKGSKSYTDGHLVHPYVWGYFNRKKGEWTHTYNEARSADWEAMPVWEYEGGIVEWVEMCGQEVALNQFPQSPPTMLNERMLNEWVRRRLHRETQIRLMEDTCKTNLDTRSVYFERRTKNCRPPFGDACQYLSVCWNAEVNADPLAKGEYVERIPHHELEIMMNRGNN